MPFYSSKPVRFFGLRAWRRVLMVLGAGLLWGAPVRAASEAKAESATKTEGHAEAEKAAPRRRKARPGKKSRVTIAAPRDAEAAILELPEWKIEPEGKPTELKFPDAAPDENAEKGEDDEKSSDETPLLAPAIPMVNAPGKMSVPQKADAPKTTSEPRALSTQGWKPGREQKKNAAILSLPSPNLPASPDVSLSNSASAGKRALPYEVPENQSAGAPKTTASFKPIDAPKATPGKAGRRALGGSESDAFSGLTLPAEAIDTAAASAGRAAATLLVEMMPARMKSGESLTLQVIAKNESASAWLPRDDAPLRLVALWYRVEDGKRYGYRIRWLRDEVAQGETARFEIPTKAPSRAGTYVLHLTMARLQTDYLPPADLNALRNQTSGHFGGQSWRIQVQ